MNRTEYELCKELTDSDDLDDLSETYREINEMMDDPWISGRKICKCDEQPKSTSRMNWSDHYSIITSCSVCGRIFGKNDFPLWNFSKFFYSNNAEHSGHEASWV